MHKNKKNGFTLVELLAVIVILAVILLIAAPKIQTVIESSRQSSIEATTKVIASNAEMIYANKKLLDKNYNGTITCSEVAKLSSDDYDLENCTIEIDTETGEATVTLEGKGAFEDYHCSGTSDSVTCTYGEPEPTAYYAWNKVPTETDTTDFTTLGKDAFIRKQGDELSACVKANGTAYCIPNNFWVDGDTDGTLTKTKIESLPKNAFTLDNGWECTAYSGSVSCSLGAFGCGADSYGGASCNSHSSDLDCYVNSAGSVSCHEV